MSEGVTISLITTSGSLIGVIVGAILGFLVKDYLDRKHEVESQRIADRREHYQNLLLSLKSLNEGKREHIELLKFEYAFLWLIAPDNVIRLANKLIQHLNSQGKTINVLHEVGELLLEMRRDLGFQHTKLSVTDFNTYEKRSVNKPSA